MERGRPVSGGRGSHAGWGRAAALAVAAGIGATRAAAAQGHDEAPDTVRLAFAWPAGAGATVVAERSRDLSENGVPSRAHATLRYRMTTERSGDGYLVRYSEFAGDAMRGREGGSARRIGASDVAAHLASFPPSYLISTEGEFRSLDDPTSLRAVLDSVVAPVRGELIGSNPGAAAFLASLVADAALDGAARQEWSMLVGAWIGRELVIGDSYTSSAAERSPFPGDGDVRMEYAFTALQRVPCDSADTGTSCVALRIESRPDPEAAGRVIRTALAGVMPGDSTMLAKATFDVRNTVHLVARPESLLPYRLTVTKEVSLLLPEGGRMSEYRQVEVADRRYGWADGRVGG